MTDLHRPTSMMTIVLQLLSGNLNTGNQMAIKEQNQLGDVICFLC